jgi:hypothetical protein
MKSNVFFFSTYKYLGIINFFSVPCLRRAASVEEEYEAAGGEVLLDGEDNDGWLATHGKPKGVFLFGAGNFFDLVYPF